MARTIASLIVVLIGSLITPCTCFSWTAGPPPNGSLQVCLGNNVSLDWDFLTSTEDTVLSAQWFFTNATHTDPRYVATASSRTFVLLSNNKTRVEFLPKAGLRLYNVSTQDLGTYTVSINLFHRWNVIYKHRSVTLTLPDTSVLSSGRLRAWVVSGTVTLRGSSHVRLACGTVSNHQHANFSVTWTTPSGRSLPSTSQADGVFYLTLDNPVAGGPYSCQLQGITALSCLRNSSQTTMAVVDVDALGARMLVLEDSARRHDRDLELQERVADVVSQSINNITVNLQVFDELTEETLERVDNLSTHVQVIDNVTTQTAQRVDKVTRNVEYQREAQSRMQESLNGVMEELTNQSRHVTNVALSVDDLKSDTAKLSESVDRLTTDTKTLTGSVDSLKSDTKTLNRSLDSLTSDTKTLKRSLDSLTSDTKTLNISLDSLTSDTKTLNRSLDSLTSDTKTLKRSQDSLTSDTKTLTRALDSLTSELRTTVDVQRKQMEAMTSQGEKQHADMVLLLQKTNNLTALAMRQQEELIQQKQTISKLSRIIDTQSGYMAQQRETITSLMSNLTSVVDVLGTMPNFTLYVDLVLRPANCEVIRQYDATSGVHTVFTNGTLVKVYCDQDTDDGGWTLIQRRQDGSVDFYRVWSEYERGFGDVSREFWLGLSNIYRLTNSGNYSLRIDLQDWDNTTAYAEYDSFRIEGAALNYTLRISGYHGNARDCMIDNENLNNSPFSTHDRDHDANSDVNCAKMRRGAWWYKSCTYSNLNGLYYTDPSVRSYTGVRWYHWKNDDRSYQRAEMKIKPRA